MSGFDETARQFGIKRPELEYYEYTKANERIISLTPESDHAWADYLQRVMSAKRLLHNPTK